MSASLAVDAPAVGVGRVTAALVGRQNSGKTSILMHVTGRTQKPVNFPGSSVERGESSVRVGDIDLRLVDLPGIASLDPISPDEEVAVGYLKRSDGDRAQVVCVVVDASKLAVELTLVRQLRELGLPVVVALNKVDVAAAEGRPADVGALSDALGVPVVPTNALTGDGADALANALIRSGQLAHRPMRDFEPAQLAARVQLTSADAAAHRSLTDKLDAILLHRVFGLPILLVIIFGLFQGLFVLAAPFMDMIEGGQGWLSDAVAGAIEPGAMQSLIIDGLINGIGSIVIFLPQIALLMLFVSVLEGTGYMARAAFLLDRPLSKVGLNGRSFVPLVSSFACAVPGILATRIIENERDRIATIVVAPLMSCSARLPVYVLLIGTFFPAAMGGVVLLSLYLIGILVAVIVALIVRKTALRGPASALMMELPVYQRPSLRVIWAQVWAGCREFMVLAGTVIFAAAVVIWLLSYYPRPAAIHDGFAQQRAQAAEIADDGAREAALERAQAAEKGAYFEQSYLAEIGRAVHPLFAPAGWDWRTTVGVLSAFPARELIIPTMGVLYSLGDVDPGDFALSELGSEAHGEGGLRAKLRSARGADGAPVFSPLVAFAVMVFFALCSQCVATLATIKRETRSWRWPVFTFSYMTVVAWLAAVLVYQVGSALGLG